MRVFCSSAGYLKIVRGITLRREIVRANNRARHWVGAFRHDRTAAFRTHRTNGNRNARLLLEVSDDTAGIAGWRVQQLQVGTAQSFAAATEHHSCRNAHGECARALDRVLEYFTHQAWPAREFVDGDVVPDAMRDTNDVMVAEVVANAGCIMQDVDANGLQMSCRANPRNL